MWDSIIDFFYNVKDKLEEFVWWVQDNVKTFLIILGVLIFSIVVFAGVINSGKDETDKMDYFSEEHLAYLKKNSEMVDKMFLNLDEDSDYMIFGASPSSGVNVDKTVSLTYNFYVRKPFTDADTIEKTLQTFLEMVRMQAKAEGYQLRMLKVNLYFRKEIYEEGIDPSGTFKYMLDYNKIDVEKLQKETKYVNSSVEGIAEGETENAKKIKSKDYREYFDYEALTTDKNIVGLTDEEFEVFIKLDKYVALAGGFDAGIKLYLNWELGANIDEKSYINIVTQFKEFRDRLSAVGEPTEYFSDGNNLVVLQDKLLITNPQILLYNKTGLVVTDPTEARKQLLEDYADEYEFTLVQFAEKQGTMYNDYNKVYEPANNNFINNMTNTQKIANKLVDSKGLPLANIDYDAYFRGEIDEKGNAIETSDKDSSEDTSSEESNSVEQTTDSSK